MKAAVLRAAGAQFEVTDLTLRALGPRDVHVQIAASGVCHSDLSIQDGTIPHPLPAVLGHEGAGVVLEVGDQVTTVAPGDHVVLSWVAPCRRCFYCLRGHPELCEHGLDHAFAMPYATDANDVGLPRRVRHRDLRRGDDPPRSRVHPHRYRVPTRPRGAGRVRRRHRRRRGVQQRARRAGRERRGDRLRRRRAGRDPRRAPRGRGADHRRRPRRVEARARPRERRDRSRRRVEHRRGAGRARSHATGAVPTTRSRWSAGRARSARRST